MFGIGCGVHTYPDIGKCTAERFKFPINEEVRDNKTATPIDLTHIVEGLRDGVGFSIRNVFNGRKLDMTGLRNKEHDLVNKEYVGSQSDVTVL